MEFGKLVLFLATFLCVAAPASAETISTSQKVVVNAVVLPAQYIIINKQNQITEVASNTYEDVLPQVYDGSIQPENQRPLSTDIYAQYKMLSLSSRPGILYKYSPESKPRPLIAALNLTKI